MVRKLTLLTSCAQLSAKYERSVFRFSNLLKYNMTNWLANTVVLQFALCNFQHSTKLKKKKQQQKNCTFAVRMSERKTVMKVNNKNEWMDEWASEEYPNINLTLWMIPELVSVPITIVHGIDTGTRLLSNEGSVLISYSWNMCRYYDNDQLYLYINENFVKFCVCTAVKLAIVCCFLKRTSEKCVEINPSHVYCVSA